MGIPLNVDWQQILLHLFNFIILAGGAPTPASHKEISLL